MLTLKKLAEKINYGFKKTREYIHTDVEAHRRADTALKSVFTSLENHQTAIEEVMVILEAAGLARKVTVEEAAEYKKSIKKDTLN